MFTDDERLVYGPFDPGDGNPRYADPVEVMELMAAMLGGNPNEFLRQARDPDKSVSFPAWERLAQATRHAFRLERFDPETGTGCTLSMVRKVLNEFLAWCGKKKASADATPMSPRRSASGRARTPSPTATSSDCGCS